MKFSIIFLTLISSLFSNEMRDILARHDINGFEKQGGTDKDTDHSYIDSYTALFAPYKHQRCSLLEIGSANGGSALLWNDYLSLAQIALVDIRNGIAPKIWSLLDLSRCELNVMNAYTRTTCTTLAQKYPEGFDIIIDDGDHLLKSQRFVLKNYISLLKPGGVLIIEDIQNEKELQSLKKAVPAHLTVEVIDLRAQKNRYDDILVVVRKK